MYCEVGTYVCACARARRPSSVVVVLEVVRCKRVDKGGRARCQASRLYLSCPGAHVDMRQGFKLLNAKEPWSPGPRDWRPDGGDADV